MEDRLITLPFWLLEKFSTGYMDLLEQLNEAPGAAERVAWTRELLHQLKDNMAWAG